MSGGGSSQTSKTEPWEGLKPFLNHIYTEAQKFYEGGHPYMSQFVGMNPGQQAALENIYAKGMTPSRLVGDAGSYINQMVNTGGNYGASPAYDALYKKAYSSSMQDSPAFGGLLNLAGGGSSMGGAAGIGLERDTVKRLLGGSLSVTGTHPYQDAMTKRADIIAAAPGGAKFYTPEEILGGGPGQQKAYMEQNVVRSDQRVLDALNGRRWGDIDVRDDPAVGNAINAATEEYRNAVRDFRPEISFTPAESDGQTPNYFYSDPDPMGMNPYLNAMFASAAYPVVDQYRTATAPGIDAAFSAAGRYGSGAQATAQRQSQDSLARGLGSMAAGIYGPSYEAERQRQFAGQQADAQRQVQGLGMLQGAFDTDQARQMQGAGMLQGAFDTGQSRAMTAAGMAPVLDAYPMQGYMQALNAAGQYQNQDKAYLADQQMMALAPYQWLQQYAGILNGMPSGFGTSTTSSGGGNAFGMGMQGLGTIIALASLFS